MRRGCDPDSFTDPKMQQQAITGFEREADMLAKISNEHIPRVFDRFSEQNHHYLVMEYVDGITLEEAIKRRGKLPEQEVVDVSLQILDTLEYLHNLSPPVIYRDLKPSNVMITRTRQVKLIDFGIARFFVPQNNATVIGTQGYAPPEQYRGCAEVRSDLYALGATMHHALSGRDPANEPPFSFPKLRAIAPQVNPAIANVVDEALQYDLVRRVRDAAEFKRRLAATDTASPTSSSFAKMSRSDAAIVSDDPTLLLQSPQFSSKAPGSNRTSVRAPEKMARALANRANLLCATKEKKQKRSPFLPRL